METTDTQVVGSSKTVEHAEILRLVIGLVTGVDTLFVEILRSVADHEPAATWTWVEATRTVKEHEILTIFEDLTTYASHQRLVLSVEAE